MKVLVTGSAGFLGNVIARLFSRKGFEVIGLDIREADPAGEFTTIICDLRDREHTVQTIVSIKADIVIHLAARTNLLKREHLNGYDANISGVRNLIEGLRKAGGCERAIYTSSQLVCKPRYLPKEDTDYCPHNLYGQSKVLTEKIVREHASELGEWCLTRPTTIWGPGMSAHYQSMLRFIEKGRYFHCGGGALFKSYGYIENAAWQYFRLANAGDGEINGKTFYIADYEPLSLRAYADNLAKELGAPKIPTYPLPVVRGLAYLGDALNRLGWRAFPFNSFRLHNILTEYVFDTTELERICGPLPVRNVDGVRATAAWYKAARQAAGSA